MVSHEPSSQIDSVALDIHPVYERRFRLQRYYLEDQLRYSESAKDVQAVRRLLQLTSAFGLGHMFQFAPVAVAHPPYH